MVLLVSVVRSARNPPEVATMSVSLAEDLIPFAVAVTLNAPDAVTMSAAFVVMLDVLVDIFPALVETSDLILVPDETTRAVADPEDVTILAAFVVILVVFVDIPEALVVISTLRAPDAPVKLLIATMPEATL